MASELSRVPPAQRRFLAVLVGPVGAALLVAGGLLAVTAGSVVGHLLGGVLAAIALLLLGVAQGLYRSARQDEYEAELDAAALAVSGEDCGGDCRTCADDCAVKSLPRR